MGIVGLFLDGTALPMITGIAGSAVVSLILTQLTLGRRPARSPAASEQPAE